MSPSMTTVGIKASLAHWQKTENVANGANITFTTNRVLSWFSVGHLSVHLEALAEDGSTWVEMEDRVGTIRPTAILTPTATNGNMGVSISHIRLKNASGLAQDVKAAGWYME